MNVGKLYAIVCLCASALPAFAGVTVISRAQPECQRFDFGRKDFLQPSEEWGLDGIRASASELRYLYQLHFVWTATEVVVDAEYQLTLDGWHFNQDCNGRRNGAMGGRAVEQSPNR